MEFSLRNELFKHLNNGYVGTQRKSASSFSSAHTPTPAKTVLSVQETLTVLHIVFFQNDIIKKPQHLIPKDSISIKGYIHMKIKIRATPDKRDFTICQDIRTSRALVLHTFLANFSDVDITKVSKPAKIAGYLNPVIKLQE